jgi:fucose 4-O-acetylase-like acetyltransferase
MVFVGFVWLCDVRGYGCSPLKALGQNALAIYVLHGFTDSWLKTYVARDAAAMMVVAALLMQLAILYVIARLLQYKRWFSPDYLPKPLGASPGFVLNAKRYRKPGLAPNG